MAYDDVIRVADIKLRPSRFARLREEAGAAPDQLVYATEYLHPRGEEICSMMPASLGAFIEGRPLLFRGLDRIVNRGRRVPVGRIGGFLQLYCVAALRPTRRLSLRHKRETEHREAWLAQATVILPKNYDLAVEMLRCRRLVKGYSDTHARGLSKFDRAMAKAPKLAEREDGAQWMARLIAAALIDEPGEALDGVAKTIDTLQG
jgi:indolepyruvate ferredoxin oxidoreductase beta subunit